MQSALASEEQNIHPMEGNCGYPDEAADYAFEESPTETLGDENAEFGDTVGKFNGWVSGSARAF